MKHRFFGYLALILACLSSSCSWLEERWPQYHELEAQPFDLVGGPAPPGTKRITTHWSCADDGSGGWFCAGREREQVAVVDQGPVPSPPRADREGVNADVLAAVDSFVSQAVTAPAVPQSSSNLVEEPSGPVATVDIATAPVTATASTVDSVRLDSYVLQLAAYRSNSTARRRLREFNNPDLKVVNVEGTISDFFVILSPEYESKADAEAAGASLREQNAGLDYWVRRSAEIQRVGASPPSVELASLPQTVAEVVEPEVIAATIAQPQAAETPSEPSVPEIDQLAAWAVAEDPAPEPITDPVSAEQMFVLQLATYRLLPGAERRLQELAVSDAKILRLPGEMDDFYAIVQGRYPNKASARRAGQQMRASGIVPDYWIRPLQDVTPVVAASPRQPVSPPPLLQKELQSNLVDSDNSAGKAEALAGGYVLQLASYSSYSGAQQRLQRLQVDGSSIVKTARFYVILAGPYPQKADARAAGEALKSKDESLDYWVRESSKLQIAGSAASNF